LLFWLAACCLHRRTLALSVFVCFTLRPGNAMTSSVVGAATFALLLYSLRQWDGSKLRHAGGISKPLQHAGVGDDEGSCSLKEKHRRQLSLGIQL
jgi:hypothetical protein